MVTVFNKSNRPLGIAGVSILPDKEVKIKDKDAYCDVYDENGAPTGKRVLLPGLVALKNMNFVTIKEESEEPVQKQEEAPVEEAPVEAAVEEKKTTAKKSAGKKTTTKKTEE